MANLDAEQKQLILNSDISALVYGLAGEFVLIRLDITEPDEAAKINAIKRWPLVGVLALRDGMPVVQLCLGNFDAPYTACFAGLAFAHAIIDHLKAHALPEPKPVSDAAEWLARLHGLEDERPN